MTKLTVDVGSGEPAFAEWFLHAAALWRAAGDIERAEWAWRKASESAPESLLPDHVLAMLGSESQKRCGQAAVPRREGRA